MFNHYIITLFLMVCPLNKNHDIDRIPYDKTELRLYIDGSIRRIIMLEGRIITFSIQKRSMIEMIKLYPDKSLYYQSILNSAEEQICISKKSLDNERCLYNISYKRWIDKYSK